MTPGERFLFLVWSGRSLDRHTLNDAFDTARRGPSFDLKHPPTPTLSPLSTFTAPHSGTKERKTTSDPHRLGVVTKDTKLLCLNKFPLNFL